MFGRYRLIGVIGEGSMGTVYRAHDTMMGRDVAIKVLPDALASQPGYQARFRREAQIAARLSEPHIIPIYEAGEINGRLFVAMPVIEGIDLHSLLQRDGPMPPQLAVRVIEQIASALDAAHAAGLVHRDIKPSNALMNSRGFVYLIDFGVAHDSSASRLTQTGSVVGTFAYMAPERFSTGSADARSDVYALACVLYECLTGDQPYPGDSLEQQIGGHISLPPPRPSAVNRAIPVGFDEVIARGMAKDPAQRYQTAHQLAAAASYALTTVPAPAPVPNGPPPNLGWTPGPLMNAPYGTPPAWPATYAAPRKSRKGWIIAGAATAVIAVTTAVVLVAVTATDSKPSPKAAPTSTGTTSKTSTGIVTSAPTSTTAQLPAVPPGRLDAMLLSAQDINTIMGATGIRVDTNASGHDLQTTPATLSNPDCYGSLYTVQARVYQGSGFVAVSAQELAEPGNNPAHMIDQDVVSFSSNATALAFLQNSAASWKACAGKTVTETTQNKNNRWAIGSVVGQAPTITQSSANVSFGSYVCQRVLSAVSNVIIDVATCGMTITNQARQIADKMAANVSR